MTNLNEQQLIGAFKDGEYGAGDEIIRRFYPKVLNICSQVMNSSNDGQDAAQEVFFKVVAEKKILRFRGQSKLMTWLTRIAINVCKSQMRKNKAKRLCYLENEEENLLQELIACTRRNPEEECLYNENMDKVHEAIEELPAKCRKAMRCIYMNDHSYKEAARSLGIPVNILGVRLMYGRKLVLQLFQKEIKREKNRPSMAFSPQMA